MRRRDGGANTGCVVWPTHLRNTGEGGMSVYALWPSDGRHDDPFYACFGGIGIKAVLHESPVTDLTSVDGLDTLFYGALCLGTSGGSWELPETGGDFWPGHWEATFADLTPGGIEVVAFLNVTYGRDAVLVTVLDT